MFFMKLKKKQKDINHKHDQDEEFISEQKMDRVRTSHSKLFYIKMQNLLTMKISIQTNQKMMKIRV